MFQIDYIRTVFTLLVGVGIGPAALAESTWLHASEFDRFHIVTASDAPNPARAAADLFDEVCREDLGYRPTSGHLPDPERVNIWVGRAGYDAFPEFLGGEGLTREGYVIRTLDARDEVEGRHLLLVANSAPATLYAVWDFLETYLGARAFGPGDIAIPEPPDAIPRIHDRRDPPFWYRDINYRPFLQDKRLAGIHQLNGQWTRVPPRYGGHWGYVRGLAGHGHTFHDFVDPEEYFDDHPEYFAEIDGERVKYAQLCLTEDAVLRITTEKVLELLRNARPNERIVSVSQMDYFWFDSWCTCDECRALDEYEESHAGSLIHFVNGVAEAVAEEFPDAYLDTFAYLYTRKPPKHVRPRDNVIVRLCGIEGDYSVPLANRRSAANRAFVRDLKRWREIADHLFVWLYTQNWFAFQAPHPVTPTFQENLALLRKVGVDGVFMQASPYSPHSDQAPLKSYLLGRLVRDPGLDWRTAEAEFVARYYAEAEPYINEYLDLIRDRVADVDTPLWFVNDLEWLDADTVRRAQTIFDRAFDAASDATTRQRLREAYLPVRFAAMVSPPDVYRRPDAYVFVRPPGPTFDAYWHELQTLGVTHLNDHPIDALETRMEGAAPPRHEVAPITTLENDRFDVWMLPARGGAMIRLRDRTLREEWIAGYRAIRSVRGRVQDWFTTDPDRWIEPEPDNGAYDLVATTGRSATLRRELDNGLVLQRRITLDEDNVHIGMTISNPTDDPIEPKVGLYGEFTAPGDGPPHLWRRADGTWSRVVDGAPWRRLYPDPETDRDAADAVALAYPAARRAIYMEHLAGSVTSLVHASETHAGLVRMGVELPRDPIEPGQERSVALRYRFHPDAPDRR